MKFQVLLILSLIAVAQSVNMRQEAGQTDLSAQTPQIEQQKASEEKPAEAQAQKEVPAQTVDAQAPTTEVKAEATQEPKAEATVEAKAEATVEAKTEATTGVNTEAKQVKANDPVGPTMTVLTPEGTTKDILIPEPTSNLANVKSCHTDNLNNPVIQLCANLKCDECLNSDVCGWCGESAQCMAGNTGDALCPGDCLNHWFFHDKTNCPREITGGSLSNVAPEATHLITPEMAEAKVRTATSEVVEAKLATTVVVGTQTTTVNAQSNGADGIVDAVSQTHTAPMTSDMVQKAPVETIVTAETHSLATGERLDNQDPVIKSHGVDQVAA